MLETEIERRMVQEVKKRGGLCYKFVSPSNPGVPDRIIITPEARVIFVELKTEIGRLSNLQKWQRDEMRKRGADVRVIKGWDAAKALIEEVMPHGVQAT
ncbi:MAG: VRR-NUC domain-containing protein [Clostridiales bacterium]|nr:VRR-NUC domain-containing protein [Clostridiales bacterium]